MQFLFRRISTAADHRWRGSQSLIFFAPDRRLNPEFERQGNPTNGGGHRRARP
jgi:hypothetical protein